MKKYIVRVDNTSVRENLIKVFEKVGKPRAFLKTLIVSTNKSKSMLQKFPGVISVEDDEKIYFSDTQEDPPNWALPVVCNDTNNYIYDKTGKNVDIYIVDKGVLEGHEEFRDSNGNSRVETIYSQTGSDVLYTEYHGTACASQAAGNTCGVAKEANILNVCVWFDNTSYVLKALDRLLEHHLAKTNGNPSIVSMSFGSTNTEFLKDEIQELVNNGIICVASAHNFNQEFSTAPACHSHVISVGATDQNNTITSFSNYGPTIDILSPGYGNLCADLDGYNYSSYGYYYGTSFSCPLVAGVLALIAEGRSIRNIVDVEIVTSILLNHARQEAIITQEKEGTTKRLLYSLVPTDYYRVFLSENEKNVNITDSGIKIYGSSGNESINVFPDVVGVRVCGFIEEAFFHFPITNYKFLQRMKTLFIYYNDLLVIDIPIENELKLIFDKQYLAKLIDNRIYIGDEIVSIIKPEALQGI